MGRWMDGWMDGWMSATLGLEQLNCFYSSSFFKKLSILEWCPVNFNAPFSEIWAFQIGPKIHNGD
jgi:hypothetical protein